MSLVSVVTERNLICLGLSNVVQLGTCSMCIDIKLISILVETCLFESKLDTLGLCDSVRPRRGCMVCVTSIAVTYDFSVNLGSTCFGMFKFLKYENSGSVTHYETCTVCIERKRRVFRVLGT